MCRLGKDISRRDDGIGTFLQYLTVLTRHNQTSKNGILSVSETRLAKDVGRIELDVLISDSVRECFIETEQ